jgi:hypothetical protein
MSNKFKETALYHSVEELLQSEAFGSFKTGQKVGTSFVGLADVVGVREIGGDVRGDVEAIAVEVKASPVALARFLGRHWAIRSLPISAI